MSIRSLLRKSLTLRGLVQDFRAARRFYYQKIAKLAINRYLRSHEIRKLQIGAGGTILPGWLASDYNPSRDVIALDATKKFPFDDNTFDYIHSEHMIEHITWEHGCFMLEECRRVLRPGGIIRVATPDLGVLIGLYSNSEWNDTARKYLAHMTKRHFKGVSVCKASFVINSSFRSYEHFFIYDGDLLTQALEGAGFVDVARCAIGESENEYLRALENHGHDDVREYKMFETMVFEGKCP